jgi:uracil-DNA glycosylase
MTTRFKLKTVDASWHECLELGLSLLEPEYREHLMSSQHWLPGIDHLFNAFSLPLEQTRYVLLGESPYPREQSANGYAFWDAAVNELWSPQGLTKPVNRATSLRNIIKMLLVAEGLLHPQNTSQPDILKVNKQGLVQTNTDLFKNFLHKGFLLLNATPVLQANRVRQDAKAWRPFLKHVLNYIIQNKPDIQLILLGNIANEITPLIAAHHAKLFLAEHPYNISFITNPTVLDFFKPLHLLHQNQ